MVTYLLQTISVFECLELELINEQQFIIIIIIQNLTCYCKCKCNKLSENEDSLLFMWCIFSKLIMVLSLYDSTTSSGLILFIRVSLHLGNKQRLQCCLLPKTTQLLDTYENVQVLVNEYVSHVTLALINSCYPLIQIILSG